MDTFKTAKIIVVPKDEIEKKDYSKVLLLLQELMSSPETVRSHKQGVDILFGGYDEDPRPIWEIQDIRQFVSILNDQFPYWLFFMSCIFPNFAGFVRCMMPLNSTQEERKSFIEERLLPPWLKAMNEISHYAGITDNEIEGILKTSLGYLVEEVVIQI